MNQVEIGKFIAQVRKEQKLTQTALGEKLGVTNKTISRWENGNYMPDISILPTLCSELGISLNELMSGERLSEEKYKESADENLLYSFQQLKKIRRQKSVIDFFSGAGTGIVVSCLWSPDSARKTAAILIGLTMIVIGWVLRSRYDKFVIDCLEDK